MWTGYCVGTGNWVWGVDAVWLATSSHEVVWLETSLQCGLTGHTLDAKRRVWGQLYTLAVLQIQQTLQLNSMGGVGYPHSVCAISSFPLCVPAVFDS